jgi:predicted carbohydrate-binding protein with CBM5 and CBM33 domain
MTKHEWRERDEEGEITYFRAIHHAGRWQYYSTKKTDPEWNAHECLPLAAMETCAKCSGTNTSAAACP